MSFVTYSVFVRGLILCWHPGKTVILKGSITKRRVLSNCAFFIVGDFGYVR